MHFYIKTHHNLERNLKGNKEKNMKNKYVSIEDLDKEISKSYQFINDYKNDIAMYERNIKKEEQRIVYLNAVMRYLARNGLCPFTKKQILNDDATLQDYAMPLVVREDINKRAYEIKNDIAENKVKKKPYFVSFSNLGLILNDFIKFVNEYKDVKVDSYLIQKFLDKNIFY